jgi:hypothetical protein
MEEAPQIHVARKTVQLGVFSPEEVVAGLGNGRFLPTDLAWTSGMAAWKPLGEWAEFVAAAQGPASPAEAAWAPMVGEPLAWEKSKSLKSAWGSFTEILLRPSPALAVSRLELGSALQFAWVLAALGGILMVVGGRIHADANAAFQHQQGDQIMESLRQAPNQLPLLKALAESFRNAAPETVPSLFVRAMLVALFVPLFNMLLGLWVWLGLRLLGVFGVAALRQADLGRTVAAFLLASATFGLLCAPLNLLPASVNALLGLPMIIALTFLASRAVGAAIRVDPWAVFLSNLLINLLGICVVGCGVGLLFTLILG